MCGVCRKMVRMMPMGDFFEQQFVFAKKFNQLALTDKEVGLLTAVMIMNPGVCTWRSASAPRLAGHRLADW